eukprot:gene16572-biopygen4668
MRGASMTMEGAIFDSCLNILLCSLGTGRSGTWVWCSVKQIVKQRTRFPGDDLEEVRDCEARYPASLAMKEPQ